MFRISGGGHCLGGTIMLFVGSIVLAVQVACAFNGDAAQSRQSTTERKAEQMIAVVPESLSIVLRASHITVITVESVQPGTPESKSDSVVAAHPVKMSVKLESNLKGQTSEHPGETAQVTVTQSTSRISRQFAMPGMWSGQDLKPGARFIVFSVSKRRNGLADILPDPAAQQVLPAEASLTDVSMSVKAESDKLSNSALLALAERFAPRLGQVFSEYLAAKLTDSGLPDPVTFNEAMSLLEKPDLAPITRTTLLDELTSKVMATPHVPDEEVNRLIVEMFRLLSMPQAAGLHEQIVQPLLPNLVGISGRGRKRPAVTVFEKFPNDRSRAEQAVANFHGEASTASVSAWLKGGHQSGAVAPR